MYVSTGLKVIAVTQKSWETFYKDCDFKYASTRTDNPKIPKS